MNITKFLVAMAIFTVFSAKASVSITNIVCQQQTPWNGKVDIEYEVKSDDANADVWIYPTGYDQDANQTMRVCSLTGEGANGPVKPGKRRMTWNVTDDYPGFNSTKFNVRLFAAKGVAPYAVIDLSGGVNAQSYPISYLNKEPDGGWTDEYKTTKMVLRFIPPGTFMMGSPSDELYNESYYETLHKVTLTIPFYMGVFETTQKQWELIMGTTPSRYAGDARPVERVSYDMIRGSVNGAGWPTHNQVEDDSFMGKLRSKTNALFDLPTEAQWEYACRAGAATTWNNGTTITNKYSDGNLNKLGRNNYNCNDGKGGYNNCHTKVGSYLPNVWGLYDMHGNVYEWCLDWYDSYSGDAVDPKGPEGKYYSRIIRGGHFGSRASYCRSASRNGYDSDDCDYDCGFRVIMMQ